MDKSYNGEWISVLYRISQAYFDQQMGQYGIGNAHFPFLLCLYQQEGVTQEFLSRKLNVDKATAARVIAILENLGYVIRERNSRDRRANKVFLTQKGKLLESKICEIVTRWTGIVSANLTLKEQEVGYNLLQRMASNAIDARTDYARLILSASSERENRSAL